MSAASLLIIDEPPRMCRERAGISGLPKNGEDHGVRAGV
jgi:hypothetical protein